ncbi:hypothetical protein [Pseudomonas chlororaphis]
MTIDKEKLKSLLWSVVASWKAEDGDLQRHTAALDEHLGDKTMEEVALLLIGENDRIEVERDSSKLLLRDVIAREDRLKAENEALNSAINHLERSRVTSFEEYDFTRLKGRAGAQKVFEITIETECGCDIEEGEYTVRVTHLLGNWLGEDDFNLIEEAVAEVITDLNLPEEGHTTFIAFESGERQDVFWTKWFEIVTVASVLAEPDAAMSKGEQL